VQGNKLVDWSHITEVLEQDKPQGARHVSSLTWWWCLRLLWLYMCMWMCTYAIMLHC